MKTKEIMKPFNVRLPIKILNELKSYSKTSGLKIWKIVYDALKKHLQKK